MKLSQLIVFALLLCVLALPAAAQVNDTYVIPVSANARGGFGSHWMTRFSLFNPQGDTLRISVTFLPTGGLLGDEKLIDLPANSLAYSDNLLEELFGVTSGSGALLVATFPEDNPNLPDDVVSRAFLVNSDTYNSNGGNGTYGQTIPGVWTGLLDYEYDQISSIAHNIRNAGIWRTNVGAVNLGGCSATLQVTVYDEDGNTVRNKEPFVLPPYGHLQQPLPISVRNGTVEFFVVDPCVNDDDRFAVVFPYTSTVDGRTNDPSYQQPVLLAEAGLLYGKKAVDPAAVGKKIDTEVARNVRSHVQRGGMARLTKTDAGWQITR